MSDQHKVPRVCVVFFCVDEDGLVVLQERGPLASHANGRLDVGGGKLEMNEKLQSALRREILEEYGAETSDIEYLGHREVFFDENNHWIAFDYACRVRHADVKIGEPGKVTDLQWARPYQILLQMDANPRAFHPALPDAFDKYYAQLSNFAAKVRIVR